MFFGKEKIHNKRLKTISPCLLFMLLFIGTTKAQQKLNEIKTAFNNYRQQHLSEKIFAHTDKTFYIAGEIIWFKLYTVDAGFNRPLDLSKVAYVELLDAVNKPMLQAKVALQNADGNGSFFIPLNISSGNYKFRAYTNWMKNEGEDHFFEKMITIVNTQKSGTATQQDTTARYDIQFFPEGGNLVDGLESKLAFKANDQYGKGIEFNGVLLDNDKSIIKFEPSHAGMGSFLFTPQAGHNYKAVITLPGKKVITKELPKAYMQGYVILAEDTKNNIKVSVSSTNAQQAEVYLLVYNNAGIRSMQTQALQNSKTVFFIEKANLPDGIVHITLFDNSKQPVCERLYFKNPEQLLQIGLNNDKPTYTTRSKVTLKIQLPNFSTNIDSANLSMSVYKTDSLQSVDNRSIETYLLLTSELKGYVEDPSWYFRAEDNAEETDNLLLTQGWRRFNWDNVFKEDKPAFSFVPEYNGHIITGVVYNTQTNNIQKYVESSLSVPGNRLQFYASTSDTNGIVHFEMKNFYGSSEIAIQAGSQFDSIYRLEINNPFYAKYTTQKTAPFHLPAQSPNTLLQRSIAMQVQYIYANDKLKQLAPFSVDTAAFYLNPTKTYILDDYTRFKTMEEVLREYVALVNVTKHDGQYHFPVYNIATKEFFLMDPINLLDGVPVFDLNKFLNIDPLQVRKLDVINQRYMYGGSSFNGLLSWTSYTGNLAGYQPDAKTVFLDYDALQLQREFYAPVYETEEKRNSHLPDFRNVLLWLPDIKAFFGKPQEISFYTSDVAGKYAVQIEGIGSKGNCGSKVIVLEIKTE